MLKAGTRIQAKLIEAVEPDQWIVSFQGQLLQVKNTTTLEFKAGMMLNLVVEKERPFRLKILSSGRSSLKINIRV